jgi:hypothetical protein
MKHDRNQFTDGSWIRSKAYARKTECQQEHVLATGVMRPAAASRRGDIPSPEIFGVEKPPAVARLRTTDRLGRLHADELGFLFRISDVGQSCLAFNSFYLRASVVELHGLSLRPQ